MKLAPNFGVQLKSSLSMLGIGFGFFTGYCIYDGNEKFYHKILMPAAQFLLSAERSHKVAILMGQYNLLPKFSNDTHPDLSVKLFGLHFSHPVGIAAGFDKQGEAVLGLLNAGFSHVEIGSVTPEPQSGNPAPRVFRLPADEAVINRYGFNSDGHAVVYDRLQNIDWKGKGVVGVNLGINKTSDNPTRDYAEGVKKFGNLCDYLVINVSSPNTEGLRKFQRKNELTIILKEVIKTRDGLSKRTPILVKISPDESDENVKEIVGVIMECRVDGIIVCNTTVSRDNLSSSTNITSETGGLSGKPLADKSTALISRISTLTNRQLPIIGVGGVSSGKDAWAKLMAGASLVQLYTGIVYYGPPIIKKVVNELHEECQHSKYQTVEDLIAERNMMKHIA